MVQKSTVRIFLLLFVFSSNAYGNDAIKGAFGIKFGQVFDSNTIQTREFKFHSNPHGKIKNDADVIYEFIPSSGYRTFSRYFLYILPVTKKVYRIQAQSFDEIKASDECLEETRLLKSLLIKKYNITDITNITDFGKSIGQEKDDEVLLRKNGVYVMLGCDQTNFLNIDYTHYGMSLLVSQERAMSAKNRKKSRKDEIRRQILKHGKPDTEGL